MYITETEKINLKLTKGDRTSMTQEEIILSRVQEWLTSEKRSQMLVGQAYYENKNAINQRRRLVIGSGGALQEDPNLSNLKLSHPFAKKLVDQKTQYLFGKPLTVQAAVDEYSKALACVFDQQMLNRLTNLCKESINKGLAWLQVFINSQGKLDFVKIPSEEVIPLWADSDSRHLEALIRVYDLQEYVGKSARNVTKVEYWHPLGVDYYEILEDKLVPDYSQTQQFAELVGDSSPHFIYGGRGACWGAVPFVPFRYNEEELPLICFIKALIDDYDLLKSDDSNSILDTPNGVLVIKNYDGTDLGEFRRNLAAYKAVKVSDNGGLEHIQSPINTESINRHLAMARKDLYEIGRGVDTQNLQVGNASGEYLKYLYADLDLDCNAIEREFQTALWELLLFIHHYWCLTGRMELPEAAKEGVDFIFNRDIIINETEAIANCVASAELVSHDTILANHPWVTDLVQEKARLSPGDEIIPAAD